jgi:hypothetical protein
MEGGLMRVDEHGRVYLGTVDDRIAHPPMTLTSAKELIARHLLHPTKTRYSSEDGVVHAYDPLSFALEERLSAKELQGLVTGGDVETVMRHPLYSYREYPGGRREVVDTVGYGYTLTFAEVRG